MHTSKIDGNRAADSAGNTESEICSPQDSIVYLAAESKAAIVNTMSMRHREILSWWAR
jgi:hypothetical protein